jgi:hypothetical protein
MHFTPEIILLEFLQFGQDPKEFGRRVWVSEVIK